MLPGMVGRTIHALREIRVDQPRAILRAERYLDGWVFRLLVGADHAWNIRPSSERPRGSRTAVRTAINALATARASRGGTAFPTWR